MEDEIVKKHIDVIIENTFNTISEVYRTQMENQKIGRVCHKSVTHPFLFFAFSQIRNL